MSRFEVTIQSMASTARFRKVFVARTESEALRLAAREAHDNDCYVIAIEAVR